MTKSLGDGPPFTQEDVKASTERILEKIRRKQTVGIVVSTGDDWSTEDVEWMTPRDALRYLLSLLPVDASDFSEREREEACPQEHVLPPEEEDES